MPANWPQTIPRCHLATQAVRHQRERLRAMPANRPQTIPRCHLATQAVR
ncbi:MAG: hypothetical protein RL653_1572, partial [Pseudomonadota bacterium]